MSFSRHESKDEIVGKEEKEIITNAAGRIR